MRTLPLLTRCVLLALATSAGAAEWSAEWQYVQPVTLSATGLVKLSVPLETISASRAGLEDLRLLDPGGRETPFLLERPVQEQPAARAAASFQVTLQPNATVLLLDTGTAEPVTGVTVQTPAGSFIKPVQVEGSREGGGWTNIVQGQPVFRQPSGAAKLDLVLSPGAWQRLRVTLDDQRSPPIPVTGALLHVRTAPVAPAEPLEVSVEQRLDEPAQTRLTLRLGGVNVTLAGLTLTTPEPLFMRPITLAQQEFAENEVRETVVARGNVYRVAVDGPAAQDLTVAVDVPVRSRELVLTIQNDDNPPLELTALSARRRPVYVTFLARNSGTFQFVTGHPTTPAPRYDLVPLRADLARAGLLSARPGALNTNAAFRAVDPFAVVATLGPALDVAEWSFRKLVLLTNSGVQQVELDPEILTQDRTDFRDLRLLRAGLQMPYVLHRTSLTRRLVPTLVPADDPERPRISRWRVGLPQPGLPVVRLACHSPAAFFRRDVRVVEVRRDPFGTAVRVPLASVTWARDLGQKPVPLTLTLATPPQTDMLELEIENGDNPPLPLENVEGWYPVTRLLFRAEAGPATFLYYGNAKVLAPEYDLQMLVPRLLAAEKLQAALAPQETLKPSRREGWRGAGWMFWAALGVVVLGLLVVLARLLPKTVPTPG